VFCLSTEPRDFDTEGGAPVPLASCIVSDAWQPSDQAGMRERDLGGEPIHPRRPHHPHPAAFKSASAFCSPTPPAPLALPAVQHWCGPSPSVPLADASCSSRHRQVTPPTPPRVQAPSGGGRGPPGWLRPPPAGTAILPHWTLSWCSTTWRTSTWTGGVGREPAASPPAATERPPRPPPPRISPARSPPRNPPIPHRPHASARESLQFRTARTRRNPLLPPQQQGEPYRAPDPCHTPGERALRRRLF
jgi:hypothetical protein